MSKTACVICDIDGTIAQKGDRGYFEWAKVGVDKPIPVIIDLLRVLYPVHTIVLMSGRDGICRELTEAWLKQHGVPYHELVMRQAKDKRKDAIVKKELYEAHIVPHYAVQFVLDDRDTAVAMWRNELGLTCLQVADGSAWATPEATANLPQPEAGDESPPAG